MPDPWLYLKAMVSAAGASALCVLTMVTVQRKAGGSRVNSACVAGVGLGLTIGYCMLSLQPGWPPTNALDRFLTIVLPVALGIELIAGFPCVPAWGAWFLRLVLAATVPRILLHGSVYLTGADDDWPLWQARAAMAVCAALLTSVWALLARLLRRSPGVSISFALCLTIQCAGLTVMMAGYIKGGAAALPIVATLMATTFAMTLITKRCGVATKPYALAIPGIGVVGLFGLLFIGHFFGRLSAGTALTILLAPLLCWATEIPLLRHRQPWLVGSLRLVLVAIPLAVVLGLAKRDFDRDMVPLMGTYGRPPVMIVIVAE